MTVAPTSRWAYETVEVTDRQRDVIGALLVLREASDQQIADHLQWQINRVTPRRGELVERELVALARLGANTNGYQVSYWRLVQTQMDLFDGAGFNPRSEGVRT
ncbi:hypothetical protein [Hypericibacter sp.]|uniref:hypothetical protein n=1 Tax=Hypericibacter sp. TaxID=2705401 RepID=UPI003D6D7A67